MMMRPFGQKYPQFSQKMSASIDCMLAAFCGYGGDDKSILNFIPRFYKSGISFYLLEFQPLRGLILAL